MQTIKICQVCGGKFVATRKDSIYCSKVCYRHANAKRNREYKKSNREAMKILVEPSKDEFDLEEGDIVIGPDKQLEAKNCKFRVTKIYKNFFEAVRIDKGFERSFTKADYLTGEVRREASHGKNLQTLREGL